MAQYKIKSTFLSAEKSLGTDNNIEQIIHETLALYDKGEDLTNSPFIRAGEWKYHKDCYQAADPLKCAFARQQDIINLYHSIKANGYNGSPILAWFDDEGYIHLYDGFHRIAIMSYLGLVDYVNVETEWEGLDGRVGRDFPLAEVLKKEAPGGQWLYQPVEDARLKGWKLDRKDSPQRLEYILKNLTGNTVLDIGCSEGYFSREIAKRGYKVTAIDQSAGLVAAARYLSIINSLDIEYHTGEWKDKLDYAVPFDNILFLSVLHNDIKKIGVEEGLEKLQAFRGKAKRVFFEVPNNTNEKQWMRPGFPQFDFHSNIQVLEQKMGMSARDSLNGVRRTYLFETDGRKVDELDSWINRKGGEHYKPLFNTLKTKPCRNIMEIGTFNGDNSVMMIKAAATEVPEKEIHYYGFDLFEEKNAKIANEEFCGGFGKPISQAQAKANIQSRTKAKVTLIKGNTRKTLAKAVKGMPEMDLIYIDGGHTVETTRNDWKYSSKLMGKNTIVYFDDYSDEMPFIGPAFLLNELPAKYVAEVMPEVNYYPRAFGRLKAQLLKVQERRAVTIVKKASPTHLRFHLLGLPHSKTTRDSTLCAFTQLTYRMATMLTNLGHEVYHYGTKGSNPSCTEQVDVLTEEVQKEAYGDWDAKEQLWIHKGSDLAYRTFRKNAIEEIKLRVQPHDILLISIGGWQKEVADAFNMPAIEFCAGYQGFFSKFKVFPSYAWMHHLYGKRSTSKFGTEDGNWYDVVIPHYFDPDDFEFSDKKDDYYLFIGRLITRKGPHIAVDLCKRIGAKLIMAGQPIYPSGPKREESLRSFGIMQPHVEYLGTVDREERSKLMSKAKAIIVPSTYFEPFGMVAVESLFAGTPIITTDWGAFPEIVKHGEVGYRCRTMDDFIWAAKNIDKISPEACRKYAEANYSMVRVSKMYQEYFTKVYDLFDKGWYTERPSRENLDWLRRY